MKRIIMMAIIALAVVSCSDEPISINDQISNLESAINKSDYSAFRNCFHDDCSFEASYTQSQFESSSFYGKTYDFYDISISGSTVNCKANIEGVSGTTTTFTMKKDGDDWKILVWNEDGTDMYKLLNMDNPEIIEFVE